MTVEFYNVALELPDTSEEVVSKAIDSVASLASVDASLLHAQLIDSHLISPAIQVATWRRAEMIRLYIVHSGRQGFLDAGVLRTLIVAARTMAKAKLNVERLGQSSDGRKAYFLAKCTRRKAFAFRVSSLMVSTDKPRAAPTSSCVKPP